MASEGDKPSDLESDPLDALEKEDDLFSLETLDRSSPELWPERNLTSVPNMLEFASSKLDTSMPAWDQGLNSEDLSILHHYGSLTLPALIVEVRKLYEKAYQLSNDETKEIARGKFLNIFNRRRPPAEPEQ